MAGFGTDPFGSTAFGVDSTPPASGTGWGEGSYGSTPYGGGSASTLPMYQLYDFVVNVVPPFPAYQLYDFEVVTPGTTRKTAPFLRWNGTAFIPVDLYVWDGTKAVPLNELNYAPIGG